MSKDLQKLMLGAALTLALGACQAIAGIEDRTLDPNVTPDASPECKAYCDKVMSVCRGDNAVYTQLELCLGTCRLMDPGDPVEPVGNTLACRMHEANAAELEPGVHCRSVGPGGNGVCGTDCEAYCHMFPQACPGDVKHEDTKLCLQACSGLTDQDRFDLKDDYTGDTIECRLVHLSSATVKPADHCPHSPLIPGGPRCVNPPKDAPTCDEYCNIEMVACTGSLAQYENEAQCQATCRALEPGTNDDEELDTVGCRRYHAFASTLSAEVHCSHSGPTGDGHCGSPGKQEDGESGNCDAYCRLVAAACPDEFAAELVDADQCKEACLELTEAKRDAKYSIANAKKSDDLSCRVLHTTRALAAVAAKEDAADECAAAVGGAPCDGT